MSADAEPPPRPLPNGEGLTDAKPITLAAVTGAHGVAGEVRLKLLGEGIEALGAHDSFGTDPGRGALTLSKLRSDGKGGAIARFAEIADRTAAEALRGTALTVPREALPPLEDDEFYHADLIGLPVVTDDGEPVGTVGDVVNYGATDIVEIAPETGKPFLVPLIPAAIPEFSSERMVLARAFLP